MTIFIFASAEKARKSDEQFSLVGIRTKTFAKKTNSRYRFTVELEELNCNDCAATIVTE